MTKKQITWGIVFLLIIACCSLFFWGFSAIRSFLAHDEFFGKTENFITKVDLPITLEQARKDLKFSLPDEATDIYYAHYKQWISYDFMVKFKAPLEVCKSHALAIIQEYNENEKNPDRYISGLTFFADLSFPKVSSQPLNVTWFDLHKIEKGFITREAGPMQPMIWIDADRNLFYYRMMD